MGYLLQYSTMYDALCSAELHSAVRYSLMQPFLLERRSLGGVAIMNTLSSAVLLCTVNSRLIGGIAYDWSHPVAVLLVWPVGGVPHDA